MPEVTVTATRYTVSAVPEDAQGDWMDAFDVQVEYRGAGLWRVRRHRRFLGGDGLWSYGHGDEPGDEDAWLAAHRFDLDTALRLAREVAPHVTVNGHTVEQVLDKEGSDG